MEYERFENAQITNVTIRKCERGGIETVVSLDFGPGGGQCISCYNNFDLVKKLFEVTGCRDLNDCNKKYIRVKSSGINAGTKILAIGHIVKDIWKEI